MKRRFLIPVIAALAALGLVGFTAGSALAAQSIKASLVVPAGLTPNDLHVQFTGTGGTIANVSAKPGAPGNPNVTGISGGGNTVDVAWANKLAPTDPVVIRFTCDHGEIGVAGGTWTNNGNVIGDPILPGSVTIEVEPTDVPGASPLAMALVALLIAGTGVMVLRRRAIA